MTQRPNNPNKEEKLERLIHQTLRELPPRRAPRSLEERVFIELRRRAALPWWRKSFTHWPLVARAGFVLMCAAIVRLVMSSGIWTSSALDPAPYKEAVVQRFSWMESAITVFEAISGFFEIMSRHIPALWIWGGLAFFALTYLSLFGLGAAAYKAIRAQP